jgi:hypothetical protein
MSVQGTLCVSTTQLVQITTLQKILTQNPTYNHSRPCEVPSPCFSELASLPSAAICYSLTHCSLIMPDLLPASGPLHSLLSHFLQLFADCCRSGPLRAPQANCPIGCSFSSSFIFPPARVTLISQMLCFGTNWHFLSRGSPWRV